MIQHPSYRRHFFFTVIIFAFFISLGILSSLLTARMERQHFESVPGVYYSKMMDSLATTQEERMKVMAALDRNQPTPIPTRFWLLDAQGQVVYAPEDGVKFPFDLKDFHFPTEPNAPVNLGEPSVFSWRAPPMLVRLKGEPAQYLILEFQKRRIHAGPTFFFFSFFTLTIAVLLATGLSLFMMFSSLRQKARMAEEVIRELQKGNLKSRFPVDTIDQMSQTMIAFNTMADEIEHLVERLKTTEQARMSLLQQLTHDLRTPVASLKNLLETLNSRTLAPELHAELTGLSLKEVEYFERLVNDLLFLAQVGEPRYKPNQEPVNVSDLLDDVLEAMLSRYHAKGLHLQKEVAQESLTMTGDAHLMRRLLVNVLDNAFSFASRKVIVVAQRSQDHLLIEVSDDGPGFNEKDLVSYGEKKASRRMDTVHGGRLSVGLGSVIIKTVVETHGGTLKVFNRKDSAGKVLGATVSLTLKVR